MGLFRLKCIRLGVVNKNNLGGEADESDRIGGEPGVGPAAIGVVVGIVDFHLKESPQKNRRD